MSVSEVMDEQNNCGLWVLDFITVNQSMVCLGLTSSHSETLTLRLLVSVDDVSLKASELRLGLHMSGHLEIYGSYRTHAATGSDLTMTHHHVGAAL